MTIEDPSTGGGFAHPPGGPAHAGDARRDWASGDALLVTGAAGFIGGAFARSCLARGIPVIAADRLAHFQNRPAQRPLLDMAVDREHLFDWLRSARPRLRAIVHLGACTNTLETDERYLAEANTRYSMLLWRYAVQMQTPFLYASSAATYGDGSSGYDDAEELLPRLRPLNAYGRSKHAFDLWALEQEGMGQAPPRWAGFKFFNVYGAGERHKGVMASVVLHAFDQIRREGTVRLFRSHRADVPDGWQQRDFVAVEDVIQVLHFALARGIARGLFNLGSGRARSFLDLTRIVFETLEVPLAIEFIETPAALRDRYQYFTQARMDKLRRQGYLAEFRSLEAGVSAYVRHLLQEDTEPDGIPPHRRPSPS